MPKPRVSTTDQELCAAARLALVDRGQEIALARILAGTCVGAHHRTHPADVKCASWVRTRWAPSEGAPNMQQSNLASSNKSLARSQTLSLHTPLVNSELTVTSD